MLNVINTNAGILIEEETKGVASGNKIQLMIQNVATNLISLNDSITNVSLPNY